MTAMTLVSTFMDHYFWTALGGLCFVGIIRSLLGAVNKRKN